MLLASYITIRPGIQGIANRLIRFRLQSKESHTEVVFEPGDGVDGLMPDGTCQPDATGALWCASSVAWERLPKHSRRAGKRGGVRFKRIALKPEHWHLQPYRRDPMLAAQRIKRREGEPYSWRLILGWVGWLITVIRPPSRRKTVCSQLAAEAGGVAPEQAFRLDPATLRHVVEAENREHQP
ncbi:hypothetical protein [Acidovorax sp. LjRoot117]|uniref:hypothetical protein n=1 Tax=Acidovorax sp. LjRoot117 TaxID=3342255 RepID=UPI003ED0A9CC